MKFDVIFFLRLTHFFLVYIPCFLKERGKHAMDIN